MGFELGLAIPAVVGWFALLGLCLLATRPRRITAAPATQDLGGDEPPALVSLLTHGWRATDTAARATLIDLAARRLIELRQPGNDPGQTTIHLRADADPSGLTRYERRVYDRVAALATNGVLPVRALTFRDKDQAKTWARRLRAEITADARRRGLSRRRLTPLARTALTLAAAGVGVAVGVALAHYGHRHPDDPPPSLLIGIFVFILLAVVPHGSYGERDTAAGRAAAARWLGLREFLRGDEAFGQLPPAAVAVWDRYLSYGCAVGVSRTVDRAIDLGMGDRKRVWSSYGGTWHLVRVRYPRFSFRYGQKPSDLVIWATIRVIVGAALLYVRIDAHNLDTLIGWSHGTIATAAPIIGAYLVVRGLYRLARAAADAAAPVTVTGEVLWDQAWQSDEDNVTVYYLAVDDGGTDRAGRPATTAWAVPARQHGAYGIGDTVELRAYRWTRTVDRVTVVREGQAWQVADRSDDGTETMIQQVLGNRPAPGVPEPRLPLAERLLTAEEVSRAVGTAVTVRSMANGQLPFGPMSVQRYDTGGRSVVHLVTSTGLPGRMTIRSRRRGTPLPGIGDEAYLDGRWAAARSGDHVVGIQLDDSLGPQATSGLPWLLDTAVRRLATDRPGPAAPSQAGR